MPAQVFVVSDLDEGPIQGFTLDHDTPVAEVVELYKAKGLWPAQRSVLAAWQDRNHGKKCYSVLFAGSRSRKWVLAFMGDHEGHTARESSIAPAGSICVGIQP